VHVRPPEEIYEFLRVHKKGGIVAGKRGVPSHGRGCRPTFHVHAGELRGMQTGHPMKG